MTVNPPPRHHARGLQLIASTIALLLVTAGCSTGSDSSSEGDDSGSVSASAKGCVDKATAFLDENGGLPDKLPAELTPLSKAPKKGLVITRVFPGAVPTSAAASKQLISAANQMGWVGKAASYDGSVEDVNRKLLAAIDASDIVAIDGIPPAAVQEPIKAAKAKGVLLMLGSDVTPPESVPGFGGAPLGGAFFDKLGELGAYSFLKESGCEGNVAVFGLPFDAMQTLGASFKKVVEEECASCKVSYTDINTADIGSPAAANAITSKIQSDAKIKFAFFTLGDLAIGIEPALKQAGVDVGIGGALPVPQNLAALKKGESSFWLGIPPEMTAWFNIDTAARALDSGKPTVGENYPVPVFTTDNIESTDPIPVYPKDYKAEFKKLWLQD